MKNIGIKKITIHVQVITLIVSLLKFVLIVLERDVNMINEVEQPKFYNVRIYYSTQCNQTRLVKAGSRKEALENARKEFLQHNAQWVKDGGNPKVVESLEVVE